MSICYELALLTKNLKLIVDPVMVSTSGARLLQPAAEKILREKLLPLAALPGEDALAAYCLAVVDQAIRAHSALPHTHGGQPFKLTDLKEFSPD